MYEILIYETCLPIRILGRALQGGVFLLSLAQALELKHNVYYVRRWSQCLLC